MNDTVANIWASMSEEERQDKILSVMDNVDAAIKFAAYDWNELPDGITNLIDSNAPLNELNKHKKLKRTMNKSTLKSLIKECYKEVLAEEYEPDYSEYSNDALTDMIINLSRYEGNEDIIGMVKDELKKRKETQSKTIQEKMNKSSLKSLIKECYREVLAENEEMDLPSDTGKNINMGFDNNIGLDVDKRMSGNMNKVMSQIEMLKNKLAPFIADFKSKKLSKEEYMAATKGLVADLKKAQMALELMMAKL
jgi:ribosomal protein S20